MASDLPAFLEDARRFILKNRSIVDLAPLQLYSSAIIFAPQNSLIRNICGRVPTWIQQHPKTPIGWGLELQKLEGHSDWVNAVAFSSNGALLASGSWDQTIRLWDTQTGRTLKRLENIPTPATICFANSNMTLITDKGIFNSGNGNSLNPNNIEAYKDNTISVSRDWIRRENQNLLWLPHEYRGITTLNGNKLTIGASSGLVSIFQF
jgi:WD40 repeat protein